MKLFRHYISKHVVPFNILTPVAMYLQVGTLKNTYNRRTGDKAQR